MESLRFVYLNAGTVTSMSCWLQKTTIGEGPHRREVKQPLDCGTHVTQGRRGHAHNEVCVDKPVDKPNSLTSSRTEESPQDVSAACSRVHLCRTRMAVHSFHITSFKTRSRPMCFRTKNRGLAIVARDAGLAIAAPGPFKTRPAGEVLRLESSRCESVETPFGVARAILLLIILIMLKMMPTIVLVLV